MMLILTILGALGVLSIPISIVVARRAHKVPMISSVVDYDVLVRASKDVKEDAIRIHYRDRDVERVSRTLIAIWNDGDTIRRADSVSSDPLRIALQEGDEPLDHRIVYRSRRQNDFNLRAVGDRSILIDFEFLDNGDGAIVELIHKGAGEPDVAGTVMGAKVKPPTPGLLRKDALAWMREISRRKRIMGRLGFSRDFDPLRSILLVLIVVLLSVLVTVGVREYSAEPKLVDIHKFDLQSLPGQNDFAKEVNDIGERDQTTWLIIIVGVSLNVLLLIGMTLTTTRRIIPRSILGEELPDDAFTRAESSGPEDGPG